MYMYMYIQKGVQLTLCGLFGLDAITWWFDNGKMLTQPCAHRIFFLLLQDTGTCLCVCVLFCLQGLTSISSVDSGNGIKFLDSKP